MTEVTHIDTKADAVLPPKPKTIEEYKQWMNLVLHYDYDVKNETQYNTVMLTVVDAVSRDQFVMSLEKELSEWASEYYQANRSELFMVPPVLKLLTKPYKSSIDKSFRRNILWNQQFPAPPKHGWVTPLNVYSQLNDLIRICLVCKFIDGPEFVTAKLRKYSQDRARECKVYSQGREEGYYAHHFYTWFEVPIVNGAWEVATARISFEIQVTTQLQEILRTLTHEYFQISRIDPQENDDKWKWETSTNRFRSAYMSHTLHLLEAIIVDLRNASTVSKLSKEEGTKP